MKKVFIVLLFILFFLFIIHSFIKVDYCVENLNASDPTPSDTNGYSNNNYYNTELPCPIFCAKYGRTETDCSNVNMNMNLRCLDIKGQMITPRCFYSNTNKCISNS
jgi:hypothetical protein